MKDLKNLIDPNEIESIIVCVKWKEECHWFCSYKDDWILNLNTLAQAFGEEDENCPERYNICILSEKTVEEFMIWHSEYRVPLEALARFFESQLPLTFLESDGDLFPQLFIDFDRRELHSCYSESEVFENYLPDGWIGIRTNIMEMLPLSFRYWIVDGVNWWESIIEARRI